MRSCRWLLPTAFVLLGCARGPVRDPHDATKSATAETADAASPARSTATPKAELPGILGYVPAEFEAVALVRDPLAWADAIGRQRLMRERELEYERVSGSLVQYFGVNPLHPEGWQDAGLDERGVIGAARMPAGEGDLYFVSVRSKERAKAAIHRFGGSRGTTDVVNGALVLAYENYGLAFVLRDDALLVLHRPAGELQEQATRLAALSAKDSLLQLAELRRAFAEAGGGSEGLILLDPQRFGRKLLGPSKGSRPASKSIVWCTAKC